MANEFIARKGLISLSNSVISGAFSVVGDTRITGAFTITGSINTQEIYFNTSSGDPDVSPVPEAGEITWDRVNRTFAMGMENGVSLTVGQEEFILVENVSGVTIPNGAVVRCWSISAHGNILGELGIAFNHIANRGVYDTEIYGLATSDIANNDYGYVTVFGLVHDVDTSGFPDGSIVYLSTVTSGSFTSTRPSPPYDIVQLGYVLSSSLLSGTVFVKPKTIIHFDDISGVNDASPLVPGQMWAVAPSGQEYYRTQGFTGSLFGTSSYATVAQTLLGSVQTSSFSFTSSFSSTASFVATSSWSNNARTASFVVQSVSASYAVTSSYSISSSWSDRSLTASYALSAVATLPLNIVSSSTQLSNGGGLAFTSSNNVTFGSVTSSLGFLGTGSYATRALTASYALSAAATLPANVVSSSAQLSNGGGVAFTSSNNVTFGSVTASQFILGASTFKLSGSTVGFGQGGDPENTYFGYQQSPLSGLIGSGNTSYGSKALRNAGSTAVGNVAVGKQALFSLVSGSGNVAIGQSTLFGSTTSSYNIAIGESALNGFSGFNTSQNVAIGDNSLAFLTTGFQNIAIGASSQRFNKTGSYNTSIGAFSLATLTGGEENTAIGAWAMNVCVSGSFNIAVGGESMGSFINGRWNTALGHRSARAFLSGSHNLFLGWEAGAQIITGSGNTIIGANYSGSSTLNNTVVIADGRGIARMYVSASGHTTFDSPVTASLFGTVNGVDISFGASQSIDSGSLSVGGFGLRRSAQVAGGNIAIGLYALSSSVAGQFNLAIGRTASSLLTFGSNNIAIGNGANNSMTTGSDTVSIGAGSGQTWQQFSSPTLPGNNSIGIGGFAGNLRGYGNIAIGYFSLKGFVSSPGGDYNIAIGDFAMGTGTAATGSRNTMIGGEAGASWVNGGFNTALGFRTLYNLSTGGGNVAIGNYAGAYATSSNELYIDNKDRLNSQGASANTLIYGRFADSASAQNLTFNAGTVTVSGSLTIIGAALFTSSWAQNAVTASYAASATATVPNGVISSSAVIVGLAISISNFVYL